jgi:DNA-binding transcriptional LysR family regulator
MSPRQLEYFLEIYNQRSIKKAAEKLIISPQAVSKTIKEIEEELQVELFIRGKKALEPTIEAEFLKNHAIKILEEYEKINCIKSFTQRENKVLTIYSVDGFLQYVTIKFIEDFQKTFPEILLNIIEITEKDIVEKLEKRDIDTAIITRSLDNEIFNCTYLYSNKNCLVINKDNPLAKKSAISQEDLDKQPIAGKGFAYSCYSSNIKKLFQRSINPQIKLETTNDSLIIKMAEHNLAIGITLDYIAFSANSENVVIKPFKEEGQVRNVFWIENNYALLTKEEQEFRKFLFKWIEKHKSQLFNCDLEKRDSTKEYRF